MAGFLLLRRNNGELFLDKALQAFKESGLSAPAEYSLGDFTLYLYHKMAEQEPCVVQNGQDFCTAIGAYIYKGLPYKQSLEATMKDATENKLAFEEMLGQYTLIIYVNNRICMVSDALSSKHFFSDRKYSFFSSSFFAAVAAVGKCSINNLAVCEKMLTGIIISPATLVNEIVQMNRNEQINANQKNCGISFLIQPEMEIKPLHKSGKVESLRNQAETIRQYFTKIAPALEEDRVDLGLSAGHDSSLLFAAIFPFFREKLHLRTHSTGHVHDREKRAAIDMAHVKKLEMTVVPTPRLDEAGIDLSTLLQENLLFFDGRTSHDIGGFSATYRASYRLQATDGCQTALTGVGGECFRNHYSVKGRKMDADKFFSDKAFNRSFYESCPKELAEQVKEYHLRKAEAILKIPLHGKVSRLNLRRYYSEILMADGQGNVIDAYNTVSHCIAPFMDPFILKEAYRGMKYLGNCGEYESALINELDPEIGACVNANNGYPFNHIPLKLRMKEAVRASVSNDLWGKLNSLKEKRNHAKGKDEYLNKVLGKSNELAEAFESLRKRFSEINFDTVVKGYAMDALVEYLALTVRKLTDEH